MTSKLESILAARHAALQAGLPFVTVLRGEVLPEELTADGMVILRDGEPGQPEETFSPHRWHFEHVAEVEVFVPGTVTRDAAFDALKVQIGTILAANRTAGGADWIEPMAPTTTDLPVNGADTIKAATIPVVLHFWTSDPLA